jgi:CheY-like chemotaxis protein
LLLRGADVRRGSTFLHLSDAASLVPRRAFVFPTKSRSLRIPRRRLPSERLALAGLPEHGSRIRMTDNAKTVLLVEDNEDNRIVYSTILQHFGYRVMEALNGEEGIAKARAEKPDLILMDISIPIIDGWEATQVLKRDPDTKHIPIIALTAHALASDREKAMEVGCDSYLAKPCEPKAVVSEVQKFLGSRDGR